MENPFINFQTIMAKLGSGKLVAVSKNQSKQDIALMQALGVTDFGENQVQKLLQRYQDFPELNWHFIGQLQRNKVKYLLGKTVLIQSLDSLALAQEIQKQAAKQNIVINCLLQLKFDNDEKRGGVELSALPQLWDYLQSCEFIRIQGFMAVAPQTDATKLMAIFSKAKEIYDCYQTIDKEICYLSLGMSADYEIALSCGANMIRIGEKLFTKK